MTGALILAAGFGTRLAPLTDQVPKPLVRVGGRAVVDHIVDRLRAVESLDRIIVITNDLHRDQWLTWAATQPPEIRLLTNGVSAYADRRGAVADLALGLAELDADDAALVVAGDNLLDEDLGAHLDRARAEDRPLVLCRDLGSDVPPGRFGEIAADADGTVRRFREKPERPESPLVATCTYVFPTAADADVDGYLAAGGAADSAGGFIGWLAGRRTVGASRLTGRYFDIGSLDTLAQARAAFADDS